MGHCVIHLSPQRVSAGCRVRPPACLPSPESCGFVICLLFIYFFYLLLLVLLLLFLLSLLLFFPLQRLLFFVSNPLQPPSSFPSSSSISCRVPFPDFCRELKIFLPSIPTVTPSLCARLYPANGSIVLKTLTTRV